MSNSPFDPTSATREMIQPEEVAALDVDGLDEVIAG